MIKQVCIACLIGLASQIALAGGPDLPEPTGPAIKPPDTRWFISSQLYLWGVNLSGSTTVNGNSLTAGGKAQEFLQHMRSTGMFWLSAINGPLELFADGFYGELKYSTETPTETTTMNNSFGMLTGGVAYRAYKRILKRSIDDQVLQSFSIYPYVAVRALSDSANLYVQSNGTTSQNQWWMQPVIGSRFVYQFAKNWDIFATGDLAYWGNNNQSYNTMAMLQYNKLFSVPILSFNIGYRYMYQYRQYHNQTFKWNMNLYGPLFGMSMTI